MKNILLPLDFSGASSQILTQAQTFAKAIGAKLWLLHVAAPDPAFVGYEAGPQTVRDQRAETLKDEHKQLQDWAEASTNLGVESEALLVQGETGATILEEAKKLNADMIVIGSHGHGALYNILVGSTCQTVLKSSELPVLVIPIREDQ